MGGELHADFRKCLCWDSQTMSLCYDDPDNGFALNLLHQCTPYIERLVVLSLPGIILLVVMILIGLCTLVFRCCVNSCRKPRPHYPLQLVRPLQVLAVCLFIALTGVAAAMFVKNTTVQSQFGTGLDYVEKDMNEVHDTMLVAKVMVIPTITGFLPSGLKDDVETGVDDVVRYTHLVNHFLSFAYDAEGIRFFGRFEVVIVILSLTIIVVGIGCVAGVVFGIRGRPIVFISLIVLALSGAGCGVWIVHNILGLVLGDVCQTYERIITSHTGQVTNACGDVTHSLIDASHYISLRYSELMCYEGLGYLCFLDFDCITTAIACSAFLKPNAPPIEPRVIEDVLFHALPQDPLLCGVAHPNCSIAVCAQHCDRNSRAWNWSHHVMAEYNFAGPAIDMYKNKIVPLASCNFGLSLTRHVRNTICSLHKSTQRLARLSVALSALLFVAFAVFLAGGHLFVNGLVQWKRSHKGLGEMQTPLSEPDVPRSTRASEALVDVAPNEHSRLVQ